MSALNDTITAVFVAVNAVRTLAYVPQILAALRCPQGARSVSLMTWGYFLAAHATGAVYSSVVVRDTRLAGVFLGNTVACLALLAVVVWRRREHGTARRMTAEAGGGQGPRMRASGGAPRLAPCTQTSARPPA